MPFQVRKIWDWQEKSIVNEIVKDLEAKKITVFQAHRIGMERLPGRTYAAVRGAILARRKVNAK